MTEKMLKDICIKKMQQKTDKNTLRRLKIISELLDKEDCFLSISIDTAFSILADLGFKKDEAIEVYKKLTAFHK